jgi:phosphate-selective porin OprO/OprP
MAAAALILGDAARAEDRNQAATDKPPVVLDEHGLTVRSPDDSVNFHLGGRLHTDFGSGGSPAVRDEFPDKVAVRRLWIEPKLTINKDLIFNLQYDPTNEPTPINNLLLSYKGFGAFTLTGGNFKEPFSLDWLTSNNDIMFMEPRSRTPSYPDATPASQSVRTAKIRPCPQASSAETSIRRSTTGVSRVRSAPRTLRS